MSIGKESAVPGYSGEKQYAWSGRVPTESSNDLSHFQRSDCHSSATIIANSNGGVPMMEANVRRRNS